jgi:predicted RNase H-like HicB family nuclease
MVKDVAKISYLALVRKDEGTDYWVDAPDIPGCAASGLSPEQAMKNFEEVLVFHLASATLLPPRKISEVLAAETDSYLEAYLIEIDSSLKLKLHFSRLS